MAKQSTVFYQLPVEEMRGKLATKQKPITYSGQQPKANTLSMGLGKHEANNYVKFIVLTKTRGQNRFYVKSRTAIRNTTGTNFQRATMAVAANLAEYIRPYVRDYVAYADVLAAYDYWSGGKTLREWLTGLIMDGISMHQEVIKCTSAPTGEGITTQLDVIPNPVYSFDTLAETIKPAILETVALYTDSVRTKALLQEYYRYYAGILSTARKQVTVVQSETGRKYTIELLYQEGSPSDTYQALNATVQGEAYDLLVSADADPLISLTVYDRNAIARVSGVAYTDAALTTPLTLATSIPNTSTIYLATPLP